MNVIESDCIQFEEISIHLPELRVYFGAKELCVSLTQLRLLMLLLSDPYGRFTNDELIRRLQLPSRPSLNVLICNVRELLDQKYIVTLHGFGYAFTMEKHS